jgi:integrase
MPSIRERAGRYHAQVRISGFPARTASFKTKRMAERWATTIEASMIEGSHFRGVEARRRTLGESITRYLEEVVPTKRDERTRRIRLRWWSEKLGHLKLAELSPQVIVEYRGKLSRDTFTRAKVSSKRTTVPDGKAAAQFKRTGATINRYLAALGHVLAIARKDWQWLQSNPFDGVSKLKEGRGRVRFLSEDERTRLLAATAKDPQLHTFVVLALSTAARAGELVNLRWRDVELKEQRVLLRVTKNSQPRALRIHGEALRLLKEHGKVRVLDDDRVFISLKGKRYRYEKLFGAACAAAKIEDFTFRGLRHTAAALLAREGATEQQLKAIGGWKSGVVSRYVHLAAADAEDVLKKLNEKMLGADPNKAAREH